MFDIGFWEILIIGVVALVVLGPERLPSAIRSTMETVRSVKNMANGFKQEVSHQLKTHELHEHLRKAEQEGLSQVGDDVKQSIAELKAAAASVQHPYENDMHKFESGLDNEYEADDDSSDAQHLNMSDSNKAKSNTPNSTGQSSSNSNMAKTAEESSSLENKKSTDV